MSLRIQKVFFVFAWVALMGGTFVCHAVTAPVRTLRVVLPANTGNVARRAADILLREVEVRSDAKRVVSGKADLTVILAIRSGIGLEGYKIADDGKGKVRITGNDENGLLYGVGRFLHTSCYDQGGFVPSAWRGIDVPKGTLRGIYFATHFNNWYEAASDGERKQYLESLALWGTNSMVVHFPNEWLTGYDDPKALDWIRKVRLLMRDAKAVGMKVGLLPVVNAGFSTASKELYATKSTKFWGDVLLCPSKPDALKVMLQDWDRLMAEFTETGLDLVVYWPYDEGGCACEACSPWGANGYPNLCRAYTKVTRARFPKAKFIASTWLFDYDPGKMDNGVISIPLVKDGEYAGLSDFLKKDKSWVDYLMIDAHEHFPPYPLQVGIPGGLPVINFPEISMIGQWPWGGYGANPLPQRFQRLWDEVKGMVSGGFPYSEGIFEDINKVVCSQYYWNAAPSTMETVEEYVAYEFSRKVVDSVVKAVRLLENNHMRRMVTEQKVNPSGSSFQFGYYKEGSRMEFLNTDRTQKKPEDVQELRQTTAEAFRLLDESDKQLSPRVRESWRWRILYLRALIDKELVRTDGWYEGPVLKAAFEELTRLYHGENSCIMLHVPKIDNL